MISVRYLMVARKLSDAINNGLYPVGSLLPTEHELSEMYQVSRHTVRAAIAKLQEQGLVSRKKRVGTRVESVTTQKGYSQSLASISDLIHMAETQVREVREVERFVAEIQQAKLLGLIPGEIYFRISSVRLDSVHPDKPVCWTDVFVTSEYAAVVPLATKRKAELIASIIESEFGQVISTIEQRVKPVIINQTLGETLNTPAGEPALQITRLYKNQDLKIMALSVTTHPRDRFTLFMELVRDNL